MDTNAEDRLVDAAAAAAVLGLKTSTIRKLTLKGELPAVYPTGRRAVRYRLKDLESLLRMRSVPIRSAG